jgi:hypothetical protein
MVTCNSGTSSIIHGASRLESMKRQALPLVKVRALPVLLFTLAIDYSHSFNELPSLRRFSQPFPGRELSHPFPNGNCGGHIVTIPAEDTYGIDVNLADYNVGGAILPPRPIQVWLPPGYRDDGSKQHPVLYVHDGDSAIEDSQSWTGRSWRLTGALVRLADHELLAPIYQDRLPICVLLPSAHDELFPGIRRRHLEYGDMSLPFAKAHVDFVAQTVKPLVDSRFATNPDDSFTIGASLGGQASLNLLLKYPNLFAGAAMLSPGQSVMIVVVVV